jgi:hypothetical protein
MSPKDKTATPAPPATEPPAPLHQGGVYVDGKRVEGPAPEYGWIVDKHGNRIPAPGPKE